VVKVKEAVVAETIATEPVPPTVKVVVAAAVLVTFTVNAPVAVIVSLAA